MSSVEYVSRQDSRRRVPAAPVCLGRLGGRPQHLQKHDRKRRPFQRRCACFLEQQPASSQASPGQPGDYSLRGMGLSRHGPWALLKRTRSEKGANLRRRLKNHSLITFGTRNCFMLAIIIQGTVTMQVSVKLPSDVVTVIVAVPEPTPVTDPLE